MGLDGIFLKCVKNEIEKAVLGARIDKIYQPNKEEFIFSLRTRAELFKLLISSRANSPRIHFTKHNLENPATPPMLCMLFRKKLSGAKLVSIRQTGFERALYLDFDAMNELGEKARITLAVEIMGKYSNVILIDQNGIIIDALKRVDFEKSSKRQIMPGLKYKEPPAQDKLCLLSNPIEEIMQRILASSKDTLSDALLSCVQGVSPTVCKEIEYKVCTNEVIATTCLSNDQKDKLQSALINMANLINTNNTKPFLILNKFKEPLDFSFLEISQYKNDDSLILYESFSSLLDDFYYEKDKTERMKVKSQNLTKNLQNIKSRLSRKIKLQKNELDECKDKEQFKICGDLLTANLYKIKKGEQKIILKNFYSPNLNEIEIKLDPKLNGIQNAQKYYKSYKKAKTAETFLNQQIEKAQNELIYIDAVLYEISTAETEIDLNEIKQELVDEGYIKKKNHIKKAAKILQPLNFVSSDGFTILVGRNNLQNDKLTLKQANKKDMWLHVKDMPGSHTIIVLENKSLSQTALMQAATLAAFHSKAAESSNIPVDYTLVKYVKKPSGAKPGMVTYSNYKTIYVKPCSNIKNFTI
ncbi:MAG: Rqc2 RqcH [Eubacteriales bacterium SKADARSKE-1]|nr:Rqc2 RqcH [Eubacteriales bacterium SKADARSKE-1]